MPHAREVHQALPKYHVPALRLGRRVQRARTLGHTAGQRALQQYINVPVACRGGGGVEQCVCHVGIQRRYSGDDIARVLRTPSSKGSCRSGAVCDGRRRRRRSRRRCCRGVLKAVDWEKEDAGESEKEDL